MSEPSQNELSLSVAERRMYARDAHASVTFLSFLIFAWGAVSLAAVPWRPFGPSNLLQAIAGAVGVVYFVSTRSRPSTRVAVGCALGTVLYSLMLLPWTAIVWCKLGRPWEAFTVPQVAMVSIALVVPRYFWIGVGTVALFAGEILFAYAYAHHVGLRAQTPETEPYFSLFFAILSVGLLLLRDQRRQLALRHIRVEAESDTLRRIGPMLTHFREELGSQLAVVARESSPLRDQPSFERPLLRIDRAVGRLTSLQATLDELLVDRTRQRAPNDVAAADEATTPSITSEAEQRLLARDAQNGTTVFAAMLAATCPFLMIKHEALIGAAIFPFAIAETVLIGAGLLYMLATRRRPSARRAMWVMLALFATLLPMLTLNEQSLLALNRPYSPFMGHKFLMVSMALVAGSQLRLGVVLNVLTAGSAIATFFFLGLGARRDLISLTAPAPVLVFMLIGIVLLVMRERRRVASVDLLRAEANAAADHRRAALILAVRDQLNSPLQSLLTSAELLELAPRPGDDSSGMRDAVAGLRVLSEQIAQIEDAITAESNRISIDAERELTSPL